MNERTTLEIIAPTVDEALAQGLAQLGLPADAVSVEVLDSGNQFSRPGGSARLGGDRDSEPSQPGIGQLQFKRQQRTAGKAGHVGKARQEARTEG